MSVDFYVNRKDIRFDELLPRLERHDITLAWSKNERAMLLSDNRNGGSCWVYAGEDGMLCGATIYAPNGDGSRIVVAIGKEFDAQVGIFDYDELQAAADTREAVQKRDALPVPMSCRSDPQP
jgi:hypothetical protein